MTKTFLLAATAITAIAFGGAAQAGTITTATRTIASEVALPTGGLEGTISAATDLTNDVTVNSAATYSVTYTLAGATFDGTPTIAATGTGLAGATGTTYIQADGSALSIIDVPSGAVLTGFTIQGAVAVPAKAAVRVGSNVSVITGGTSLLIDTAAAKSIVDFKPLIAGFTAEANSAEAQLPDYVTFSGGGTSAVLATNIAVSVNSGTFYSDLNGAAIEANDVIDGITATVSGPAGAQLDVLSSTVGSTDAEAGATDTSAVYELSAGDVAAALDEGVSFAIDNADEVTLNGAVYAIKLAPEYADGFAAAAEFGPYAAGEVTLEGTNFIAPWFTLNNANNTATLRLANQGTAVTGPVFVTLKAAANGATATNNRVQISEGIAAGSTLEISGPALAAALGTSAQNGDLQITIQADGSVISGKVRVRNVSGATFESSLGNLDGSN